MYVSFPRFFPVAIVWQSLAIVFLFFRISAALQWQTCGSRVAVVGMSHISDEMPLESFGQHAYKTDASPLDLTEALPLGCCRQSCLRNELPLTGTSHSYGKKLFTSDRVYGDIFMGLVSGKSLPVRYFTHFHRIRFQMSGSLNYLICSRG